MPRWCFQLQARAYFGGGELPETVFERRLFFGAELPETIRADDQFFSVYFVSCSAKQLYTKKRSADAEKS